MSKSIEFKVEVFQVGLGRTKTKTCLAKSLDRLISSMSKQDKKKWKTITYIENGEEKIVKNK